MCNALRELFAEELEQAREQEVDRMQELIRCMLMGGDQDQLPRLSERAFLEQMYLKYSI